MDATSEPVIRARALAKRFGERSVVRGIDLEVPGAGCFGLLGPNGAGKTTTLRMILGLSPVSGGSLHVLGEPMPASGRRVRAAIGVVPQIDNLDPDFTVAENLRVYASYFGLGGAVLEGRIRELLEFVELDERAGARVPTLSGGMRRRLSIARALVNDPRLLVLDEPTTGLDPQVRHLIWQRLRELRRRGKSLLLTTHYMDEAERLCDSLVIMDHGRIIAEGPPKAIIAGQVEASVVEIHAEPGVVARALEGLAPGRMETVGETTYCYTGAPAAIVERLEELGGIAYFHRPANLEDVFLRLTGHELRE